jgi:hypothetical protein
MRCDDSAMNPTDAKQKRTLSHKRDRASGTRLRVASSGRRGSTAIDFEEDASEHPERSSRARGGLTPAA